MKKLKLRYFLSVLFDYAIYILILIAITKSTIFDNSTLYGILINVILLLFWLEEIPFRGYSVGKFIMRIKLVSVRSSNNIYIKQLIIRRILEIVHVYKIVFWRLKINIDKISGSQIVAYNTLTINKKNKDISESNKEELHTDLRLLSIKAFLIDLLIIIWIPIISTSLTRIPLLRNYIDTLHEFLFYSINGVLAALFLAYWIFKDFKYTNGSYGKIKVGILLKSDDGKNPSKSQIIIKNILSFGLFPIEVVIFALKKKTLGESVSFTHIEIKSDVNV